MSDPNEHQEKAAENQQKPDSTQAQTASGDQFLGGLEEEISAAAKQNADGEGFANPLEALAAENSKQEAEITDLKDRLLRSAAEMENLRRRTQKDIADARSFSISNFARDLLGVADNLLRAMEAVPQESREDEGIKTLLEGVGMTERELGNTLEKHGVKKLDPKGEKFDPNFHQAMFEVQNPEVPNNTVMEVVQAGYVIGERVLRPAMVGVAKGGPKRTAQTEASEA